ncbi:MAG TPA: bifunctional oligoribonuclease/PAP phosphatase NrnA [Tepidisphaeraceae bacterium]|jgi:phosphoesterase RecJ-like protein
MPDRYRQIIDVLSRCRRVLVTTHVRPDGDALGTVAAMVMGLRKAGVASEVLLLSGLPRKYAFIFEENSIPHHEVDGPELVEQTAQRPFSFEGYEAIVVMDTGTWSQLPGLRDKVMSLAVPKLVIDHHLTQEDWADVKLVVTEAAAAGEITAELLTQWDIPIDRPIATALFLAIASDTGWFQFSNTRPYTMRLAAMLMEADVDTDRMYQLLYQNERAERVALQSRAMQSLELLEEGRLAVMRVTQKDFTDTRAGVADTENLINLPLQIRTVEVSILIVEPGDTGPVRVSLRSKGQVDVAKFAEKFGGGGHARASGLKLETSFQEAHDQVVAAMRQTIQE